MRARHGYAILLDGHSIRRRSPAVFRGTPARPESRHGRWRELRAGVPACGGARARPRRSVFAVSSTAASRAGTSRATTGPRPRGVHALQLETAQACYMDESPPYRVGREARGAARRRCSCASWRLCSRPVPGSDDAADIHRVASRRGLPARRSAGACGHQGPRLQRAHVEHRRRRSRPTSRSRRSGSTTMPTARVAADVLRAYQEERNRTGSIVCAKCGEDNPATFELCWKCGWSFQRVKSRAAQRRLCPRAARTSCFVPSGLPGCVGVRMASSIARFPALCAPTKRDRLRHCVRRSGGRRPKRRRDSWRRTRARAARARHPPPRAAARDDRDCIAESRASSA